MIWLLPDRICQQYLALAFRVETMLIWKQKDLNYH